MNVLRMVLDQVMVTWRLVRDPRVPLWMKIIPFLGLVYVLSPLDFIPDFIIGVGQLDDLGVVLAVMRLFETVVPTYLVQEHRLAVGNRHTPQARDTVDAPSYTIHRPDDEQ